MKATGRVTLALLVAVLVLGPAAIAMGASTSPSLSPVSGCDLIPGEHTFDVDVDGTTREALVHVPPAALSPGARLPLVLAFHGYSAHDWQLAATARLGPIADADGFVVVYPEG